MSKNHTYVEDIVRLLLRPHSNSLGRRMILRELRQQRRRNDPNIPHEFDASVQSSYEQYCRDSLVFQKSGKAASEALFHWPEGKGAGIWALIDPDRARKWLEWRKKWRKLARKEALKALSKDLSKNERQCLRRMEKKEKDKMLDEVLEKNPKFAEWWQTEWERRETALANLDIGTIDLP